MTDYAIDVEPKTQFLAIGPDGPQNAGMITPAQCRAARGFLNWTQPDLAREAQVGKNTLIDFEKAKRSRARPPLSPWKKPSPTPASASTRTHRAWVGGSPTTA